MPVKKPIRRKKSTRVSGFAWTSVPAMWNRGMKRFTRATESMDTSTIVAISCGAALFVALLVVGSRTKPAVVASADQLPAAAGIEATMATPPTTRPIVNAHAVEAPATNTSSAPQLVTIAGCLAQDGETFRLKDTSGEDAPRSRSWKSGFLRKGPAPVDVIDASHRLKLTTHVGERVSVTGTMVDGEMQVRSLRRVSSSCSDGKPKLNA